MILEQYVPMMSYEEDISLRHLHFPYNVKFNQNRRKILFELI